MMQGLPSKYKMSEKENKLGLILGLPLESYVFIFDQWSNKINKADAEATAMVTARMLHFVQVQCEMATLGLKKKHKQNQKHFPSIL